MQKWIVRFDDLETVELLKNMGLVTYVPTLYKDTKIVFIETDLSEEEILNIKGITSIAKSRAFKLDTIN
jgi:hypothetical protein